MAASSVFVWKLSEAMWGFLLQALPPEPMLEDRLPYLPHRCPFRFLIPDAKLLSEATPAVRSCHVLVLGLVRGSAGIDTTCRRNS